MIYFDNAATSGKKPPSVINAVNKALTELSANPGRSGHNLSKKASELIYETRKNVAELFGFEKTEGVIFTNNCTQSINTVLKGVLSKGDHIIITDMEHNAVMRPIAKMGLEYTAVNVSLTDDESTLLSIKNAIKPNTKMIFVTAASNVIGKKMPLKDIGNIAKENGLYFAVDGAQGGGVMDIDMEEFNIDYLSLAAHKGLYAPMGTGVLLANKDIKNTIIEGGTGTNSISLYQPEELPEKLESGTVNLVGIAGINAGVNFVRKYKEKIVKTEDNIITDFYSFLKNTENIELYTPSFDTKNYVPVISFNVKGLNSQITASLLNDNNIAVRAGLHCAPMAHKKIGTLDPGTVRVSPGYFNTANDLALLKKTVKKICENRKKYIE